MKKVICITKKALPFAGAFLSIVLIFGLVKRLREIPAVDMCGANEEYQKKYPIFSKILYHLPF